jgi:20S proteasome alpha/beta subunit
MPKAKTGTVCIAARFKGGVLCATDTAVTTGGTRVSMNAIKGFQMNDSFVMFAGTLYYAQALMHEEGDARTRLLEVREKYKDDADEDGCNLLEVTNRGDIFMWSDHGEYVPMKNYAAIGSGGDLAMFGLDLVYSPERSERWLRAHVENIIFKIAKRDVMVYADKETPVRWHVVRTTDDSKPH